MIISNAQRPWPIPKSPWVMRMEWNQLLFAHWPVAAEQLRATLPPGLELDTWKGQGWVGVVPFTMVDVSPRFLPRLSWTADFAEINVRTYVTYQGKPGVWFFSLDAANRLAVQVARRLFHLPYFNAKITMTNHSGEIHYQSVRRAGGAIFTGRYRPEGPVYHAEPGSLDEWLTSRYCFYCSKPDGMLYRSDVQHEPWPLQRATAEIHKNTMGEASGLKLPDVAPVLHYSEHLKVIGWLPAALHEPHRTGL